MKTTLIVVGRTVEQHYITAINDYIARTKHFNSFDKEVIPELKNTKPFSRETWVCCWTNTEKRCGRWSLPAGWRKSW